MVSRVAYEVDLPSTSKIHRVFHVSRLKLFKGSLPMQPVLSEAVVANQVVVLLAAVLGSQTLMKNGVPWTEALIQWDGSPPEESSWESLDALIAAFPSLNLEDKVIPEENGDDRLELEHGAAMKDI